MTRRSVVRLRAATSVLAMLACAVAGACDPCSGVLGCSRPSDSPYLAVDGQVVDLSAGVGVDGVRVVVVRRGGVAVARDSITTMTAGGGHWRVEFNTSSSGFVDADIAITTPAGRSYTVPGVRLTTTTSRGDANVLDRWVDRLYFPDAGELFIRGSDDIRVAWLPVEFHRTGGVELLGTGAPDGVVRTMSDFAGRVALFSLDDANIFTNTLGPVVGDLILRRSATDSTVIRNVGVPASYLYRPPTIIIRLGIGPSLAYEARFISRATGVRVPGVAVSFERLSGIGVVAPTFSTVADTGGTFAFHLQALEYGLVQGRLIYRAPLAAAPETLMVALPTFDTDSVLFYGKIGVGVASP